eukprot:4514359-Pyramimonas_sp.AAC.1
MGHCLCAWPRPWEVCSWARVHVPLPLLRTRTILLHSGVYPTPARTGFADDDFTLTVESDPIALYQFPARRDTLSSRGRVRLE